MPGSISKQPPCSVLATTLALISEARMGLLGSQGATGLDGGRALAQAASALDVLAFGDDGGGAAQEAAHQVQRQRHQPHARKHHEQHPAWKEALWKSHSVFVCKACHLLVIPHQAALTVQLLFWIKVQVQQRRHQAQVPL